MMNKKRGLTDITTCPAMEIPKHQKHHSKSGAKEKYSSTPMGQATDKKHRITEKEYHSFIKVS